MNPHRSAHLLVSLGRALLLLGAAPLAAWYTLPLPWAVVVACACLLAWAVAVLGAELERYVAIAVVPAALTCLVVAGAWIVVVQPVVERVDHTITDFTRLMDRMTTLPKIPSVPKVDVGGAASGVLDQARAVVGGAK